jgi:hypothetical protein
VSNLQEVYDDDIDWLDDYAELHGRVEWGEADLIDFSCRVRLCLNDGVKLERARVLAYQWLMGKGVR